MRKRAANQSKHYLRYASGILWGGGIVLILCAILTCLISRGSLAVESLSTAVKVVLFAATVLGLVLTQDGNSNVVPYLCNGGGGILLLLLGAVMIDGESCSFAMPFVVILGTMAAFFLRKNRRRGKPVRYHRSKNR